MSKSTFKNLFYLTMQSSVFVIRIKCGLALICFVLRLPTKRGRKICWQGRKEIKIIKEFGKIRIIFIFALRKNYHCTA